MERLFIAAINVLLRETNQKNNAPTVGAVRTLQSKYQSTIIKYLPAPIVSQFEQVFKRNGGKKCLKL